MKTLDLLEFPLDRHALIEASAGTGKTYTLANLYVRYLLEGGMAPDQVLVVTFTEAATQELRDRIRQRIRELLAAFEAGESQDALLQAMLESSQAPQADAMRLRLAERQMDLAEIHTIHGFCQRLLGQFAMDLGVPLQQTLEQDLRPLLLQAMEDFWRTRLSVYTHAQQNFVLQRWATPERLLDALSKLLNRVPETLLPHVDSDATWQAAFDAWEAWVAELKARTRRDAEDVRAVLQQSHLKSLKHRLNWFETITEWAQDPGSLDLPCRGNNKRVLFEDFLPPELEAQTKKNQTRPQHEYFDFLDGHFTQSQPDLAALFMASAYLWLRRYVQEQKRRRGVIGFDDLIAQVDLALAGAGGDLCDRVAGRYRVALIDEFQDTDPAQYRIFKRLFAEAALRRMVLIGDPKQAIYGFRGGDIATYLCARRDIENHELGELYTMDTNWRSSPDMVAAVNALFAGHPAPFMHADIPFQPVQAAKSAKHNAPGAAMYVHVVQAKGLTKEALNAALAQLAVAQIQALLENYASSDIAVLVRSSREAELMQSALAETGIRASFEGQQNVFESQEAASLYFLLKAVAEPESESLMCRSLSDPLLGLSDDGFMRLTHDPHFHAKQQDNFVQLQRIWREQGVLAMVRCAMHWYLRVERGDDPAMQQRWERCLSNFNQLAELLQQQAQKTPGFTALIRFLYRHIHTPGQVDDVSRLRLESDESLVRIVTIHKSKGLEYPIVLVPFLYSARAAEEAWFYDDTGRLCLDLSASEASLVRADQERMAEDMRLLYVALTRARYRCLVGTANYGGYGQALGWWRTALGQLVTAGQAAFDSDKKPDAEQLNAGLQRLASGAENRIAVSIVDTEAAWPVDVLDQTGTPEAYSKAGEPEPALGSALTARALARVWSERWQVQSFTRLLHLHQSRVVAEAPVFPRVYQEPATRALSIHRFPRGAAAGTFLHQVFEAMALETGELNDTLRPHYASLSDYIHEQLQRYQLVPTDQLLAWSEYLSLWVNDMRQVPIWQGFHLGALSRHDYLVELAFDFSVKQWPPGQFNALCRQYLPELPAWQFDDFEGLLTGAIDLVVRHKGRYYILDYKSNYLGEDASSYHAQALNEVMLEHGYHLQYLVYCLALHRFLGQRLKGDYDYDRHLGGVAYLFLRGMGRHLCEEADPTHGAPGIFFTRPDKQFIEALDAMTSLGSERASGGMSS